MIDVNVKLRGKISKENYASRIVQKQIQHEVIGAIGDRLTRKGAQGSGGKGLGVRRNVITRHDNRSNAVEIHSTRKYPRTTGKSWHGKNIAIAKSMAPRVANKAARRIEAELSL